MSGPWRLGRIGRAGTACLVVSVVVLTVMPSTARAAHAASDGGASSRVAGRGEIITSIFGRSAGPRRNGGIASPAPRCRWLTLSDVELEWIVGLRALEIEMGLEPPVMAELEPLLSGTPPDGDHQLRLCGASIVDARFVPRDEPLPDVEQLHRQMVTRLPIPEPELSPPPGAVIPVGQPVFVSIPEQQWREVDAELSYAGLVAQVRARPMSLRVVSGDPGAASTWCSGRGRPFDPTSSESPRRQATRSGVCSITYRTANLRAPRSGELLEPRPFTWLGTVTVLWAAQWRLGDGPWQSLGTVQRTRLVNRTVRELTTSIRSAD